MDEDDEVEAVELGAQACRQGKNPSDNPFPDTSVVLTAAWARGFRRERLKNLRGLPI